MKLIELAVDEEAQVFDFTIGEEPFKLRFATEIPRVGEVFLTRSRALFVAKRGMDALRSQRLRG